MRRRLRRGTVFARRVRSAIRVRSARAAPENPAASLGRPRRGRRHDRAAAADASAGRAGVRERTRREEGARRGDEEARRSRGRGSLAPRRARARAKLEVVGGVRRPGRSRARRGFLSRPRARRAARRRARRLLLGGSRATRGRPLTPRHVARGVLSPLRPGVLVVPALAQLDGVVQEHELALGEARGEESLRRQRGVVPELLAQSAPRALHEPRVGLGLQVMPGLAQGVGDVAGEAQEGVVQSREERHRVALPRRASVEVHGEADASQLALHLVQVSVDVPRAPAEKRVARGDQRAGRAGHRERSRGEARWRLRGRRPRRGRRRCCQRFSNRTRRTGSKVCWTSGANDAR